MHTFGYHLQQVISSIDSIDEISLKAIKNEISRYLSDLGIVFIEHLVNQKVNDKLGIKTFWDNCDDEHKNKPIAYELIDKNGKARGQAAYSCIEDKTLWVINKNGGLLHNCKNYNDLWSGCMEEDIPPYMK